MAITKKSNRISGALKNFSTFSAKFFEGNLYPIIVTLLIFIGYTTAIEFYLNIPIVLMACLSLIVCKTVKPLLPVAFLLICQVNVAHTPAEPTFSGYYAENGRLGIIIALGILLVASLIYFIIRNVVPHFSYKKAPLFWPLVALCAAFILNGIFSSRWTGFSLLYGFGQAMVYFALFYLFYYGLKSEKSENMIEHFSYLSLIMAIFFLAQLAFIYLTVDGVIKDGQIIKEKIVFGWTINNPFGFHLAILIPPLMRGAMKGKRMPYLYLVFAILAWAGALLTLSRNAWIFATLALGACFIISCFYGQRKKIFRIITISLICIGIIGIIVLREQFATLFSRLLKHGLSNNGRYELWEIAFENFKSNFLLGVGFYGFGKESADFLPMMAHNTILQLASATGIFGVLAYLWYRGASLVPLFKKFTYEKVMLYLVVAVTVGESLIDNYVFYFVNAFPYIFVLALLFKIQEDENIALAQDIKQSIE